jgi:hypothetical protein
LAAINRTLLVIGYGSLLSGYGLLSERRGGASRLVALDAFPVRLFNARRGLAKPTGHGRYLAMDLEPIDPAAPIVAGTGPIHRSAGDATARPVNGNGPFAIHDNSGCTGLGALGLIFDRDSAPLIARREEYDAAKLNELLDRADRAGLPIGEFLMPLARRAGFNPLTYRCALRELLGYTSPGYIFHPLPLDDGRVAIVAIGSGFEGSGDPAVQSKRARFGMDRLLTLGEALAHPTFDMDPIGQTGYYLECVLGGYHGLDVSDLIASLPPQPEDGAGQTGELAVAARVATIAKGERERFMRATSLDEARYTQVFGAEHHPSFATIMTSVAGASSAALNE